MQLPPVAVRFSESEGKLKERHLSVWVSKRKSEFHLAGYLHISWFWGKRSALSDAAYLQNWGFSVWVWKRARFAACPAWRSSILHRAPITRLWLCVEHVFKCELHCLWCSNRSWQLWLMRKAWQACRFIQMSFALPQYRIWPVDGDSYLLGLRFERRGLGVESFSLSVLHRLEFFLRLCLFADFICSLSRFPLCPYHSSPPQVDSHNLGFFRAPFFCAVLVSPSTLIPHESPSVSLSLSHATNPHTQTAMGVIHKGVTAPIPGLLKTAKLLIHNARLASSPIECRRSGDDNVSRMSQSVRRQRGRPRRVSHWAYTQSIDHGWPHFPLIVTALYIC